MNETTISNLVNRLLLLETNKYSVEEYCKCTVYNLLDYAIGINARHLMEKKPHFFSKEEKLKLVHNMGDEIFKLCLGKTPSYLYSEIIKIMLTNNYKETDIIMYLKDNSYYYTESKIKIIIKGLPLELRDKFSSIAIMMKL